MDIDSATSQPASTRWRILHLEDNDLDREIVREALVAEGIDAAFVYASTREELMQALAAGDCDLILSDFTLPRYDGLAALAAAQDRCPDVPYIFVSGTIGEERAVEGLKCGATDYVLKDHLERLLPAIRRALREANERCQRRIVERALRESEERYRLVFERHPQPMWVYDIQTERFLAVNDATVAHYGYTREEFVGKTIVDIAVAEDAPAFLNYLNLPSAKDQPTRLWRHRKKDGSRMDVEVWSHDLPFFGRNGRVVTVNDVTERRLTEERFATIFRSAPVAIGYGAVDGTIIDANQQLCDFLGYGHAEMVGRTVQELQIWPDLKTGPAIEKLLSEKVVRNHEMKFRRKSGEIRTGLLSMEVIQVANDSLLLAMIADVTDQKSLEAQLQRANRVESVGRLTSGIAHDMNNILAPIMMATPLLRLNIGQPEAERTLTLIEASAKRGADLVRQLLMFGRGIEGERGPIAPSQLISDITSMAGQTFPKNITIESRVSRDAWAMRGDQSQLHQILLNLCVNARDAMPRGGALTISADNVRIDEHFVSMHADAQPGLYVRISVCDTGAGIAPEIMERIFDPFFTTKEVGHGTGLGLSTVLGIVKSHAGFVSLRSELGRGTTFEIYLPAIKDADENAAAAREEPAPRGKNELILVVDDEESIRIVLRETLIRHGYRVVVASDGAEATAIFARTLAEVKMVITDLDMPVMDGISLLKILKRMRPDICAMVSTGIGAGRTSKARSAELQSLGIATVLIKPYTAENVLTNVHKCLNV